MLDSTSWSGNPLPPPAFADIERMCARVFTSADIGARTREEIEADIKACQNYYHAEDVSRSTFAICRQLYGGDWLIGGYHPPDPSGVTELLKAHDIYDSVMEAMGAGYAIKAYCARTFTGLGYHFLPVGSDSNVFVVATDESGHNYLVAQLGPLYSLGIHPGSSQFGDQSEWFYLEHSRVSEIQTLFASIVATVMFCLTLNEAFSTGFSIEEASSLIVAILVVYFWPYRRIRAGFRMSEIELKPKQL